MDTFVSKDAFPAECSQCGKLVSADGFLHQKRKIDCHVLIFVLEGTLYIAVNGAKKTVKAGELVLLPMGEEHYGYQRSAGRLSYFWAHFTLQAPLVRQSQDEQLSVVLPDFVVAANRERISLLFRELVHYGNRQNLYTKRLVDGALEQLLMELTQEYLTQGTEAGGAISPAVNQVMEWIRNNCEKPLTRTEIAETFHYNPDYLAMRFKKETGMTLLLFLNQERVARSKALLSCGSVSVKEAAYESGFRDEKYYMRTFKKLEGMTPSQYKASFEASVLN